MTYAAFSPLLSPPLYPIDRYAKLADRLKKLLFTQDDIIILQAEALLALEAAATSIAQPDLVAVNIVTSPYGTYFGAWLSRGGTTVNDLTAEPGKPIAVDAVKRTFDTLPKIDIVSVVHGEAANGALNPLKEVAKLAKARGALLVVDAVASFGAHPLHVDALGIDIAAIGPQKALAGPVGLSALTVSKKAWAHIEKTRAPSPSLLSLTDIKENWLDRGRGALPGTPPPLEFWAFEAALTQVEAEGIERLIARHQKAARASRAGVRALGISPWIEDDEAASALVTSAPVPDGIDAEALIAAGARLGVSFGRGFGSIEGKLVRFDHTGLRAAFGPVLANVVAYGAALADFGRSVDVGAAARAVAEVYQAPVPSARS